MARIDPRRLSAEQLWLILSAVVGLIVSAAVTAQLLSEGVLSGHLRKSIVPFERFGVRLNLRRILACFLAGRR